MKRIKTKYPGIAGIKTKNGISYYVRFDGKELNMGSDLKIALNEKKKREKRVKRGNYEAIERQERTTFRDLLQLYESKGGKKSYILQWKELYLKHFGDRRLAQITRASLFEFRDALQGLTKQRGCEPLQLSSINRALAGLRKLLLFGTDREYLEVCPSTTGLLFPEPKGLRKFFTVEQMTNILNLCKNLYMPYPKVNFVNRQYPPSNWLYSIVLTAYLTGMRIGEILSLKWKDVDLNGGIIYLPSSKTLRDPTGQGQRVVMQQELITLLKALPTVSERVFCQPDGTPWKHGNIYHRVKRVFFQLGIDPKEYSIKEFRHTTASHMNIKGVPLSAIQDQMRHADSRTTKNFYIGADVEYQREMAERLGVKPGEA